MRLAFAVWLASELVSSAGCRCGAASESHHRGAHLHQVGLRPTLPRICLHFSDFEVFG